MQPYFFRRGVDFFYRWKLDNGIYLKQIGDHPLICYEYADDILASIMFFYWDSPAQEYPLAFHRKWIIKW